MFSSWAAKKITKEKILSLQAWFLLESENNFRINMPFVILKDNKVSHFL